VFSGGRQSEPLASDKAVCGKAMLGSNANRAKFNAALVMS
jgi:hypothetical protein